MKLIHQCVYCSINIFDADRDLCWKSPGGKHSWRVVEKKEIKENNNNLKDIVYV